MKIGKIIKDSQGLYHGRIYAFGFNSVSVIFDPQVSKDNKEYYRLIADPVGAAYEIGAAFPKQKGEMTYLAVNIESPALPAPINAALFPDKHVEGQYNLIWNRPENQGLKAEATVSVGGKSQAHRFATPKVN